LKRVLVYDCNILRPVFKERVMEPIKHPSNCECEVCLAMNESGLRTFNLSIKDDEGIDDQWYLAVGKSLSDFGKAVRSAKSKIDDMACTEREIYQELRSHLEKSGFVPIWKFEEGQMNIEEVSPVIRGFAFEMEDFINFDKEVEGEDDYL